VSNRHASSGPLITHGRSARVASPLADEGQGEGLNTNVSIASLCAADRSMRDPSPRPLPHNNPVCAGDKVDTCSETWWTHFSITKRRVAVVVAPVDPVGNAQGCPQVHRPRFHTRANRPW